jgi:uncharacterized protein YcbX
MRVSSLSIYPVKATAPVALETAEVEPFGLRHDRRWAVIDDEGKRLNAGRHDVLMRATATPEADGSLTLTAEGHRTTYVREPRGGPEVAVDISRMPVAIDSGDEAAAFFSGLLGLPARLVWQDDPARRSISAEHGGLGGEPLNLADTGPLLLTSTTSLAQLNAWIAAEHDGDALVMQRFRPNVVIDGCETAFAEDDWRDIRIGDVPFRFAECCDRCATTTIDPVTLAHGKEPIRTLARHRKWAGKTWFGIRIIPLATGKVSVGDEVTVV